MTFEQFIDAYLDGLVRYAAVLTGSRDDAHDLLADVLVEVRTKWSRIGRMANVASYVRCMLTSRFVDRGRRLARSRAHAWLIAEPPERATGDVEAAIDDQDHLSGLLRAIPARQRAALVLRYYLDLTDRDIARELGCAESTVRSLVARGLEAIRARLLSTTELRSRP